MSHLHRFDYRGRAQEFIPSTPQDITILHPAPRFSICYFSRASSTLELFGYAVCQCDIVSDMDIVRQSGIHGRAMECEDRTLYFEGPLSDAEKAKLGKIIGIHCTLICGDKVDRFKRAESSPELELHAIPVCGAVQRFLELRAQLGQQDTNTVPTS